MMTIVKVSPKFQVVIPKDIRRKLNLKAGQCLQVIQIADKLQYLPVKDIKKSKGFLKGIDTKIDREGDRF